MDLISFFTKEFVIDGMAIEDSTIRLNLGCSKKSSDCPKCGARSQRIHSIYIRSIHDLMVFGKTAVIQLFSRKFLCESSSCSRRVFTEIFETLIKSY